MRIALVLIGLGILCGGCSNADSNAEVITLVAAEEVRLVEVDSVVGGTVRYVGNVQLGQNVPVVECRPRKSDIDLIVAYNGQRAVAWQGKYKLNRRAFDPSRDSPESKTSSCWGLLGG